MAQLICHYCEKNDFKIDISGKTLIKSKTLIDYRICTQCSKILAMHNPSHEKQKRLHFLEKVKNNAIKGNITIR
jgi:protein-arginine kinase activator protein McsA